MGVGWCVALHNNSAINTLFFYFCFNPTYNQGIGTFVGIQIDLNTPSSSSLFLWVVLLGDEPRRRRGSGKESVKACEF